MISVERENIRCNIELEYRIGGVNGYKCFCCGHHLGSVYDDENRSDTGFEEFVFCPYCGTPLYK